MKQATSGMLYFVTDYLFAHTTEDERNTFLAETKRGRKESKSNLTDNDGRLYFNKKIAKKILKEIKKTL